MLESLTINKSSKLYRFLCHKIPHPEWCPLDRDVFEEAILYYVNYPDMAFAYYLENKIVEEITLALIYLDRHKARMVCVQIKNTVFSVQGYPEKASALVFRLKKAVAGTLYAAEDIITC